MPWWSWGLDDVGETGRVPAAPIIAGDQVHMDAALTSFPAGVNITSVVCAEVSGAGLAEDGHIYVWGGGRTPTGVSKFGDQFVSGGVTATTIRPPTMLTYTNASSATELAITNFGLFWRRTDGTVWGVGRNQSGEFGIGEAAATYHGTPVQLTTLPASIQRIWPVCDAVGLFAQDGVGNLYYSGENRYSADGHGVANPAGTRILTFTTVSGITNVRELAIGGRSTTNRSYMALTNIGTVSFWGWNMASPTDTTIYAPTLLSGVTSIAEIHATNGTPAAYFLTNAGTILGFGSDDWAALQNGAFTGGSYIGVDHYALPLLTISLPSGKTAAHLTTGSSATFAMFAVCTDGSVYGWGLNDYLWGSSDPDVSIVEKLPPIPLFPSTFGTTHPIVKMSLMGENCPFLFEEARIAVPARLATIVG